MLKKQVKTEDRGNTKKYRRALSILGRF